MWYICTLRHAVTNWISNIIKRRSDVGGQALDDAEYWELFSWEQKWMRTSSYLVTDEQKKGDPTGLEARHVSKIWNLNQNCNRYSAYSTMSNMPVIQSKISWMKPNQNHLLMNLPGNAGNFTSFMQTKKLHLVLGPWIMTKNITH